MIKQNNETSSNFLMFTDKEISQQTQINELINIAKKYGMHEIENYFISERDKSLLHLINYICDLNHRDQVPTDIEDLFLNNIFLKEQVNYLLEKKLFSLINDDTSEFSRNISVLTSILSIGTYFQIFDSSNNFDFISISNLFRFYENRLSYLSQSNTDLFEVTYQSYLILLKFFIQICAINSIDFEKIKDIKETIDLLTETVNIVKFTILLNEDKLSKINNLQGKCLYYFSHLDNVTFNDNEIENSLKKYLLIFERQEDGFILSKNNNFGYEISTFEEDEFLIFKNYVSILLLNLIKKLESCELEIFKNNEYYIKIVRTYNRIFQIDEINENSFILENFKKHLITTFFNKYHSNLSFEKKLNYLNIIEDFIFSGNEFDNKNLEIIYKILYYINDIEDFKFLQIIQQLIDSNKITNNYYEFFKLEIFDLFIEKFIDLEKYSSITILMNEIYIYLIKNHFDFNLISMQNKLIKKLENKKIIKYDELNYNKDNATKTEVGNSIKYDFLDDDYEINY